MNEAHKRIIQLQNWKSDRLEYQTSTELKGAFSGQNCSVTTKQLCPRTKKKL